MAIALSAPRSNRDILENLVREARIRVHRAALFDTAPPPLPHDFDFNRIEGMMLGLAVGDSLGNTTESMIPHDRRELFGEVRDYLPNRHAGGRAVGLPSDDTQLALWTLERLIADRGLDPERLTARFARDRIFGIGKTVREFLAANRAGAPWWQSGPESAGNGALMRIAPILIPHLQAPTAELWVDTALAAMVTHNDRASISACLAFVRILWELLSMSRPPPPEWWAEKYVEVARPLEGDTRYRPRGGAYLDYSGPLWRFVEMTVPDALRAGRTVREACNAWYSGAFLLETVPSVLYILARHGDDPEETLVRAVNDTKDNDSIAAIVGAAVGALHGADALPARWRSGLLGRTGADDDGRVFELLASARAAFRRNALDGNSRG
ncbi:MAG: ADP-ribosylglycohydrolase family protein [Alphaproteobacteria bacterium]